MKIQTKSLIQALTFIFLAIGVIGVDPVQAESLDILPIVKQYNPNGEAYLSSKNISIIISSGGHDFQKTALTLKKNLDVLGYSALIRSHPTKGENIIELVQENPFNLFKLHDKKNNILSDIKNQGYRLVIQPSNHLDVKVTAKSRDGIFYGTRSLLQLLAIAKHNNKLQIPAGTILDYPSFKERSVMIDVGRRYFKMTTLKKYIRLMSYYKMNMLHLHLSDYSAFRLKDDRNGPYVGLEDKQSYTHADINMLRNYATRYHIQIVPEIDVPAHASAIAAYYRRTHSGKAIDFDNIIKNVPACADMNTLDPSLKFMLPPIPMFTLNVTDPNTVPFIEGIITYFMAWFRMDSEHPEQGKFFSIGADEYPNNQSMLKCMNGMHQYARTHMGYENYDNWYKLCHMKNGNLAKACKGNPKNRLYSVLPGGIYVKDFINKIDHDIFQNKVKSDGVKMRIWTGWNASNYADKPGGPWKYSASPIDPNNDIHLDSWLVNQNLNNFLNKGYSLTNTSYQMTYLIPGSSNQFWNYPFPQDYQARAWIPITYQAKSTGTSINVNNSHYKNFFGAGLQIWSDEQTSQMSDDYYYALSRRPIMLTANNVWAGNNWRSSELNRANLSALATNMAKIGQPPQDSVSQEITPKYCASLVSLQKSNKNLYTVPIPWTISFTINSSKIKDNALHPVLQILDKSRTMKKIKKELNRDDYSRHDLPGIPYFKQNYLPFVAIILKRARDGVYVGYYDGITGWEARHVVKICGDGSNCKPPLGTFMLKKSLKSGAHVKLVGNITGVKAIVNGHVYKINDSVMSLPIRNLNTNIAANVRICNYALE